MFGRIVKSTQFPKDGGVFVPQEPTNTSLFGCEFDLWIDWGWSKEFFNQKQFPLNSTLDYEAPYSLNLGDSRSLLSSFALTGNFAHRLSCIREEKKDLYSLFSLSPLLLKNILEIPCSSKRSACVTHSVSNPHVRLSVEGIAIFQRYQLFSSLVANVIIKRPASLPLRSEHRFVWTHVHNKLVSSTQLYQMPFFILASAGVNHPRQQRLYLGQLMTFPPC